ncbi:MAG: hypothetical protein DRP79_05680 [Planctomycetota bacterium]|nr:MAG: hypothetical protein DRP79_05680 [Planctomycetota bacterium]
MISRSLHGTNLVLCMLFFLFAISLLWSHMMDINTATQVVRPEESPHVAVLQHYQSYIKAALYATAWLSVLISVLAAILSLAKLKGTAAFRWASFALYLVYPVTIILALSVEVMLIGAAGVALFAVYAAYEAAGAPDREAMARFRSFSRSVGDISVAGLLRFLAKVFLVFACTGAIMLTCEALAFTMRFAGRLFTRNDFATYLAYASAGGILACVAPSILTVVPVLIMFAASKGAKIAKSGLAFTGFALLLPLCFGAVTGGLFYAMVYNAFHAEIADLGLGGVLFGLPFTVGYMLVFTTYINFKFMLKRLPDSERLHTAGDYAAYLVTAMVSVFLFPLALFGGLLPRRLRIPGRAFLIIGLLSSGALLYLAGDMNYPPLVEYSYSVQGLYSVVMTGLAVCTLFVLARVLGLKRSPRLRLSLPVLLLVWGVSIFTVQFLHGSQQMRLIMNEYAPLGRTMSSMVTGWHKNRLGMDRRPDGEFKPYAAEHKTLPANPGVRDFRDAPPPIIFIIFDAERPDRMGIYGYERKNTPRMEKYAKDFVIFRNARSASTATSCAMKNAFTGCYSTRCMTDIETLEPFFTTDLLKAGYGRFFINYFPTNLGGIALQTFLHTIPANDRRRFEYIKSYSEKEKVEETLEKLGAYEKEISRLPPDKRGYFVYLHFLVTHFPWRHCDKPSQYKGVIRYGDRQEDLYDEDVNYADITLERLFEGLKKLGIYEKAVIVITADHGAGLNEHGKYGGFFPYEEQIRVPLFIKIPGVERRVIDVPWSHIDLAPTLVNLVERGVPSRFDGISFLPILSGKENTVHRRYLVNICAFHDSFALIQDNRWKLIYNRDRDYYVLYDLENDPKETRNLSDRMPGKCAELIAVLERFLWQGRGTYANPSHSG